MNGPLKEKQLIALNCSVDKFQWTVPLISGCALKDPVSSKLATLVDFLEEIVSRCFEMFVR